MPSVDFKKYADIIITYKQKIAVLGIKHFDDNTLINSQRFDRESGLR